jgi:hypothetical protein
MRSGYYGWWAVSTLPRTKDDAGSADTVFRKSRHTHRAWPLYRELDLGGARHKAAGPGRDLYFADVELPRAGENRRHSGGERGGGRADAGKIPRPAHLHLLGCGRARARRRGLGEGAVQRSRRPPATKGVTALASARKHVEHRHCRITEASCHSRGLNSRQQGVQSLL